MSAPHWLHGIQKPPPCMSVTGSAQRSVSDGHLNGFAIIWASKRRLAIRNEALSIIGGSALTDEDMQVPEAGEEIGANIPVTYVPFRNAHFLSAAVSWAEVLGAEKIYIGAVEQDSSGYPDCRPEYYRAFNAVIKAGTREGTIQVVTPLIAMRKVEIVRLGMELGRSV